MTAVVLAATLAGCGEDGPRDGATDGARDDGTRRGSVLPGASEAGRPNSAAGTGSSGWTGGFANPTRVPGIGDRMWAKVPREARQVVTVHGEGPDSPDATVRLYTRKQSTWTREHTWPAHNGRKGWTPNHRENDKRSPVGVFTLSDAGGLLPDPGSALPYEHNEAFTPPSYWPDAKRNDFDHVIAVDYNRVRGTTPLDPTRPRGQSKGGGIWLHLDHGYGTSGCVSLPREAIVSLLRTLDPADHPVVVMGDKKTLSR
ncbi:L,D-transpeptidase family protein [Streptomyces sp. HNM0574]|uniref:L,D-transpeptidase family protein n=1 Tax=Streptomyces sp. HNM0574 TaxID=2714954 RepID=UPI0032165A9A